MTDPVEKFKQENPEKSLLQPEYWGIPDELLYSSNPQTFALKLLLLSSPQGNKLEVFKKLAHKYASFEGGANEDDVYSGYFLWTDYFPDLRERTSIVCVFLGMDVVKEYAGREVHGLVLSHGPCKKELGNILTFEEYESILNYTSIYDYLKNFPPFQRGREILENLGVIHAISLSR